MWEKPQLSYKAKKKEREREKNYGFKVKFTSEVEESKCSPEAEQAPC
jgi:hypothetical protein